MIRALPAGSSNGCRPAGNRCCAHGGNAIPLLLDKILTLFALPLGMALCLGILALTAMALRRRRMAAGLLAFALAWLWIWSTPLAARAIAGALMNQHPPQRVEDLPEADAIVVLGGGIEPVSGDTIYPDMNSAADRLWHAARLHKAGKAPLIIASAGIVWQEDAWGRRNKQTGAEAMRILLAALGVPESDILQEGNSRSTHENAQFTGELAASLEIESVLLVTSAWHMPRALAAFERTPLQAIPAPCDHAQWRGRPMPAILMALPGSDALSLSGAALREHLGLLIYRLRGWA